ncbi:tubulin-folding cofactor B-like [Corticium candelabrum]|uniref:tubulin-folding cofactor B-like n=1 Tax=Corticium candelabrum TaxID=121492 RepID=UPI002E263AAD|nr:tubulin-folding cofactor B-like [Corticium candelabrum]
MDSTSHELILLNVTSSVTSFTSERRFGNDTLIAALKGKLELITGATARYMTLELYDKDNKLVKVLENDDETLKSYKVTNGMRIHVVDKDPAHTVGDFEDLSKVEKYEMSDDAYAKREDSVRSFKQRMKMGRFADQNPEKMKEKADKERTEKEAAKGIAVGSRCEVRVSGSGARRGTVAFVGETDFKPGIWVGMKYDEPVGKNDGSVGGKRYFSCEPKYGGFVKPSVVVVGDFPEEDIDVSDDEV